MNRWAWSEFGIVIKAEFVLPRFHLAASRFVLPRKYSKPLAGGRYIGAGMHTTRIAGLFSLLAAIPAFSTGEALNPDVTQETIATTICTSYYTNTVRPTTSYTNKMKGQLLDHAGIDRSLAHEYTLDHIIPLALGGHPSDPDNLQL